MGAVPPPPPPSTSTPDASARAAEPGFALGPATRLLWRSADSVHLELGHRAVVVDGLPAGLITELVGRAASAGADTGGPSGSGAALSADTRAALQDLAGDGF